MGGFLSALAGAGAAAAPYNARMMELWEKGRENVIKSIDEQLKATVSPGLHAQLNQLRAKAGTAKPGDDPSKLLQEFQLLTQVHPTAMQHIEAVQGGQPKPQPGPAAPGTVPGSMQIPDWNSLSGGGGAGGGGGAPAAMPSGNPISPASGGGGGGGGIPPVSGGGGPISSTLQSMLGQDFITPMQQSMNLPQIQAELQSGLLTQQEQAAQEQARIAAENARTLKGMERHNVAPNNVLTDNNGRPLYTAPDQPHPITAIPLNSRGIDPISGVVKVEADPQAKEPTTAFAAAKLQRERELGRLLTSEETIKLQRDLAGGDPLYPVITGNGIVWTPRGSAAGQSAPRTLYDEGGMPTTGGQQGVSTTPPPPPSDATQTQIAGFKTSVNVLNSVKRLLDNPSYATLGPIAGKIKLAEINKLGGTGATPQQIELATKLKRLIATQAFADAGKSLSEHEKELFTAVNPSLDDTLETAIVKTRESLDFINQRFRDRISVMPERQRKLLGVDENTLVPPVANAPIPGNGPITLDQYRQSIGLGTKK